MIPYGRQDITEADIEAVIEVLRSDFITQGPVVSRFEEALAARCNVAHAVAVNSATSALHIACLALGLGQGDRLWTSPNTFVASANCGLYCGAEVDFVDIDPLTYNISVEALAAKLAAAEAVGRLPKIVVPVHFAGQSCDMVGIRTLADRYGFSILKMPRTQSAGATETGLWVRAITQTLRCSAFIRSRLLRPARAAWRSPTTGTWQIEWVDFGRMESPVTLH